MAELVLREDVDHCATLTLNRPDKLNALSIPLFMELRDHIDAIAGQADSIGLVILRGAGRSFCAGNDLDGLAAVYAPPRPGFQAETIERLANLPQPVIAAVRGHCMTGGLELALAADLIVATHSAKFADTHAKFSLTPVWGMSQRLPRRIGVAKAREMAFTCRTYSGVEAAAMGLVNESFPDEAFDDEVQALARRILANSWFSLRAYKTLFNATDGLPLGAGLAHEVYRTEGRGPDMGDRIAAHAQSKQK
jgi:enoyl-CoA hydratase/carnithine racemase